MNLNISRSTPPRAAGARRSSRLAERLRFWRTPLLALLVGLAALWPAAAPRAEDDFIPPEQAFKYTVSATADAIKEFEVRRADLEKAAAEKLAQAQAAGEKLAGTTVKLTSKVT